MIFWFVLDEKFRDPFFNAPTLYLPMPPVLLPFLHGQSSVLHLALTCRSFHDPALNVLYSHLRGTWPLIQSLPDELILSHRPPRPPVHTPELFRPLVLRAAHVHILFNDYCHNPIVYPCLLASTPKDAPLFPKIRSLTWYDWSPASIPVLSPLLPTIDTLALDISNDPFRKAIIPVLRTAAPCLKALELAGWVTTSKDGPSEIELLLLRYPEGFAELLIGCFHISNSLLNAIAAWLTLNLSMCPSH
ncbi:hypothetical protein DFH29DRAFT_266284 [Suillus ampliporus]|nr:hypothetical protein DFH29DRAFT_266284 [Suillus ampliporus]